MGEGIDGPSRSWEPGNRRARPPGLYPGPRPRPWAELASPAARARRSCCVSVGGSGPISWARLPSQGEGEEKASQSRKWTSEPPLGTDSIRENTGWNHAATSERKSEGSLPRTAWIRHTAPQGPMSGAGSHGRRRVPRVPAGPLHVRARRRTRGGPWGAARDVCPSGGDAAHTPGNTHLTEIHAAIKRAGGRCAGPGQAGPQS